MPKFAFFGTPYVARDTLARLVASGFTPAVVITSPDAPQGRGMVLTPCETKIWALEHNIPVLTPEVLDDTFQNELASFDCELGIAVAYGKILPESVITAFPKGVLNVHYSLLPRYRGASPVEAALWHGDSVTGVTVQRMVYALDAGDIVAQKKVAIEPSDTTRTLRPRLIEEGAELLIDVLPGYVDGSLQPIAQNHAEATRAPKIRKEQGKLDLAGDGRTNWNTYRALRESPGTYFFACKDDATMRVKITNAEYVGDKFVVRSIIPEGKKEQDFSYLANNGWTPC